MASISVILPTYNRPRLLPHAVRSAFAAGSDIEVIVVDDGSIDETAAVCRELPDIKYVRLERNQGVAGARNVGILHSEGEYISFLDDDDRRLPGSFDLQARLLDENRDAGFTCGGMLMADQNYRLTGEIVSPRDASGDVFWKILELDFPIMGLSALIRKESLLRVGLLDRNAVGIDDWDIFVRLAELFPVVTTQAPVGIYRQPTWKSGQGSSERAKQLRRLARHQRQLLKLPRVAALTAGQRRAIRRRTANQIADTLLWGAFKLVSNRELKPALRNVSVALQLSPFRLLQLKPYQKLAARLSAAKAQPASVVKYEQIFGLLDS